ncbi:MAG: ABC transporter permease [Nanoarchaeota archaeon]
MSKLLEIIKKNLKLLIRSRSSALIVLLGPLALMLLIGLAFNTSSLFDIKVGTYSSSYSEISDSIVVKLQDEQFKVMKIDNEERCINMIKTGDLHVCTIFPPDLSLKTNDKIVFYVDKSRINFVYIILDRISSKIATKSAELSTALTSRLLSSLNNANAKLTDKSSSIVSLSASLSESKSSLNDIVNDLDEINLNVTSNFTQVHDELKQLKQKDNSSSKYADLEDLIDAVESDYDILVGSVRSFRDSSSSSLGGIKTKLSENIQSSKDVEKTIKEINNDINSIEIRDVARIVSPVTTEIKPIAAESTNLNYTFPTLLVLVLLFAGLLLASTTIVQERESKAYFRNFITPTPDIIFILGNYVSSVFIVLLQLVIIFIVMFGVTSSNISDITLLNSFVILALLGSVFILLGMLIGYMFKSGETANIASVSLGAILLFFSNTILPIETLPSSIRQIVQFNPYIVGESALRKILLFNQDLSAALQQIYILVAYIAGLLIVVYLFREFSKKWLTNQ